MAGSLQSYFFKNSKIAREMILWCFLLILIFSRVPALSLPFAIMFLFRRGGEYFDLAISVCSALTWIYFVALFLNSKFYNPSAESWAGYVGASIGWGLFQVLALLLVRLWNRIEFNHFNWLVALTPWILSLILLGVGANELLIRNAQVAFLFASISSFFQFSYLLKSKQKWNWRQFGFFSTFWNLSSGIATPTLPPWTSLQGRSRLMIDQDYDWRSLRILTIVAGLALFEGVLSHVFLGAPMAILRGVLPELNWQTLWSESYSQIVLPQGKGPGFYFILLAVRTYVFVSAWMFTQLTSYVLLRNLRIEILPPAKDPRKAMSLVEFMGGFVVYYVEFIKDHFLPDLHFVLRKFGRRIKHWRNGLIITAFALGSSAIHLVKDSLILASGVEPLEYFGRFDRRMAYALGVAILIGTRNYRFFGWDTLKAKSVTVRMLVYVFLFMIIMGLAAGSRTITWGYADFLRYLRAFVGGELGK